MPFFGLLSVCNVQKCQKHTDNGGYILHEHRRFTYAHDVCLSGLMISPGHFNCSTLSRGVACVTGHSKAFCLLTEYLERAAHACTNKLRQAISKQITLLDVHSSLRFLTSIESREDWNSAPRNLKQVGNKQQIEGIQSVPYVANVSPDNHTN